VTEVPDSLNSYKNCVFEITKNLQLCPLSTQAQEK